jgi:hypothetical protein
MGLAMVLLRRLVLLGLVLPVACVLKERDRNPEFAAQGDSLDSPVTTATATPTQEAIRIGAPVADGGDNAALPTTSNAAPTPTLAIAVCPLDCHIADGPRRIPLPQQELDALRSAFGPTMSGLRQCASTNGGLEDERHKPTLNLRFGPRGELLDVGVDPTGWDATVEDCMQQVVRGGAANPQVSIDGPADVRCSEKCERHARWTTAPR